VRRRKNQNISYKKGNNNIFSPFIPQKRDTICVALK
jgi:hypothetical protein